MLGEPIVKMFPWAKAFRRILSSGLTVLSFEIGFILVQSQKSGESVMSTRLPTFQLPGSDSGFNGDPKNFEFSTLLIEFFANSNRLLSCEGCSDSVRRAYGINSPDPATASNRVTSRSLEAVSKPPNADHSTRKVHESIIHCDIEFMSNEQSSKVTQPCKSAFDGPSSAITPKLATVLRRCSFSTFTMGTNQIPLRLLEPFTKRIAVVSTVGNQRDTTVFWARDLDKHAFDELDFRWGRACFEVALF